MHKGETLELMVHVELSSVEIQGLPFQSRIELLEKLLRSQDTTKTYKTFLCCSVKTLNVISIDHCTLKTESFYQEGCSYFRIGCCSPTHQ